LTCFYLQAEDFFGDLLPQTYPFGNSVKLRYLTTIADLLNSLSLDRCVF